MEREMDNHSNFNWQCHEEAWNFTKEQINSYCKANEVIHNFSKRLTQSTGMRLIDTVDHLVLEDTLENRTALSKVGFIRQKEQFVCPNALIPPILLTSDNVHGEFRNALRVHVEDIISFQIAHALYKKPQGRPLSTYRLCNVNIEKDLSFGVIERQLENIYEPDLPHEIETDTTIIHCYEQWLLRPRIGTDDHLFDWIMELAEKQIDLVGKSRAAYLFFKAERQYWQSRNRAARVMKNRLNSFGIGWVNHDHHTYRSSRKNFSKLITFFLKLGFKQREKFYTGEEAQWGAQLLEHEGIGIVLFCDVDLEPQELGIDFVNDPLPRHDIYGTIELWTALHGDSLFQAGLHHLAVASDFDSARKILKEDGIDCMKSFSNFHHLQQSFTVGELWKVPSDRVEQLLSKGIISPKNADRFIAKGALGSHLEIIQREDGFKGFNQKKVSTIIKDTDPKRTSIYLQ